MVLLSSITPLVHNWAFVGGVVLFQVCFKSFLMLFCSYTVPQVGKWKGRCWHQYFGIIYGFKEGRSDSSDISRDGHCY